MTSSPDLTLATIKMVLALALVLGLLWGLYRLTRKKMAVRQNPANGAMVRIIENRYLGVKKSIALVQVPGAFLVVGVSPDKVNLLSRIDDPDILSKLDANLTQRIQPSFMSIFQRIAHRQTAIDPGAASPDFSNSQSE